MTAAPSGAAPLPSTAAPPAILPADDLQLAPSAGMSQAQSTPASAGRAVSRNPSTSPAEPVAESQPRALIQTAQLGSHNAVYDQEDPSEMPRPAGASEHAESPTGYLGFSGRARLGTASSDRPGENIATLEAASHPSRVAVMDQPPAPAQASHSSHPQAGRRRLLSMPLVSQASSEVPSTADDLVTLSNEVLETQALAEETLRLEAEVTALRGLVEQAGHLVQIPRIKRAFADVAAALHILQASHQYNEARARGGANSETQDAAASLSASATRLAELADGFRAALESNPGRTPQQDVVQGHANSSHPLPGATELPFPGFRPLQVPTGLSGSALPRSRSFIEQAQLQTRMASSSRRPHAPAGMNAG
ncbi:hypothetical protein WJX74_004588 [Apatococcus lobatus]|uniref:Uncharacterized protein n=1 Tax=Apatococcus lobatus TaxID=904363 RepID=A0AAW1RWH5_9CHLO